MSEIIVNAVRAAREYTETEKAFALARQAMIDRLLSSLPDEAAERERLYLAVQVLDEVRQNLMDAIATGQIETYAERLRTRQHLDA
jgi:hypothetical protein